MMCARASRARGGSAASGKSDDLIAFVSTSSGGPQLYVVQAAGAGPPVQLTDDAGGVGWPQWTPDGERVLVLTGCPGSNGRCSSPTGFAIMRPDGSSRVDIAGTSPVFSPDGNWLSFLRCEVGVCDLRVARANGNGERLVDTGVRSSSASFPAPPAWSSDGKKLVYIKGVGAVASIWQSDRQGHASPVLEDVQDLQSAVFFPDDDTVAFVADFAARIFTISVGESAPTFRTTIGDVGYLVVSPTRTRLASQAFVLGPGGSIQAFDGDFVREMGAGTSASTPVWSPDSSRIAYTFCDRSAGFPGGPCSLRVVGPNDTKTTVWNGPATEAPDWVRGYGWSSDSTRLVMSVAQAAGPFRLNVVNADGTGLEPLLPGNDDQYMPAWRP